LHYKTVRGRSVLLSTNDQRAGDLEKRPAVRRGDLVLSLRQFYVVQVSGDGKEQPDRSFFGVDGRQRG
jgi:hypothetical protein